MTILLTAIGKRVELITHLKTKARVVGVDCSELNAAKQFVDAFYLIPAIKAPGYVETVLEVCEKEEVDYLIPLFEPEFLILDQHRDSFEHIGTKLLLSDKQVLQICNDKYRTADFFEKYSIPAPTTYHPSEWKAAKRMPYPLVIKPASGMGSADVYIAQDIEDFLYCIHKVKNPVVQELVKGTEYTMDVLCDEEGNVIYNVPRQRLEVRSGEVNKSKVDLNQTVMDLSAQVMEALNKEGGVRGPFTLQCFLDADGKAWMLEINPRFGGGVPLSFAAGADYASALQAMCEGKPVTPGTITEKTMLRYDMSVFLDA